MSEDRTRHGAFPGLLSAGSYVRWGAVGSLTAFFGTLSLASSLVDRRGRLQYRCMAEWSRRCLQAAGVRVTVRGLENVRLDGPQIFFSSHASVSDICALSAHLPVEHYWLARKEIFRVPFIGWHLQRSGHLRIDRGNRGSAVRLLQQAAQQVRAGKNVVVFPEGTRSEDGRLKPFKKGVFHLALDAQVPIVPVRILGSHLVITKGRWEFNGGDVTVALAPPIDTAGLGAGDLDALMSRVRGAMESAAGPE